MKNFVPFYLENFMVKLAETEDELNKVYRLRYLSLILDYNKDKVDDGSIDKDEYDEICDHLIAINTNTSEIVGTYRLIRKEHLNNLQTFLTEVEFDITNIKNIDCEILEIGRAVVREDYRSSNIISLLWKGIINYALSYNIKYMIGTACFHGTNPMEYKNALSYLYHYHRSPSNLLAYAQDTAQTSTNILEKEQVNKELVLKEMPALIKGYLRLGATISEDAFIDYDFNAIDVLIVLDVENINPRYVRRFIG